MKSKKTNIERVPYSSKNAVPGKVVYITIVGPPRKRRNETREDGVYHMRTNGKKSKKENSWYWYKKEGKETEPPQKERKNGRGGLCGQAFWIRLRRCHRPQFSAHIAIVTIRLLKSSQLLLQLVAKVDDAHAIGP